jgi:hypothetical protein
VEKEVEMQIERLTKALLMKEHKAWESVNNPAGWASGEVRRRFNDRCDALIVLVRAIERLKNGG